MSFHELLRNSVQLVAATRPAKLQRSRKPLECGGLTPPFQRKLIAPLTRIKRRQAAALQGALRARTLNRQFPRFWERSSTMTKFFQNCCSALGKNSLCKNRHGARTVFCFIANGIAHNLFSIRRCNQRVYQQ